MSPASYLTAPPRVAASIIARRARIGYVAARPAAVSGSPFAQPNAASFPFSLTCQPKTRPVSAWSAYRYRPSELSASSRRPGSPSTDVAATASCSAMLPSLPIAYVEMVPSPKLVTKTVRPSLLIAAQQTSLRVLPTAPLTGASLAGPSSRYEDAEALPTWAPAASVTTTTPSARISKPYGVAPDERCETLSRPTPSPSTANAWMLSDARSVTSSVRPSGVNATCAGSLPEPSGRIDPCVSRSWSPWTEKPARFGSPPVLRT